MQNTHEGEESNQQQNERIMRYRNAILVSQELQKFDFNFDHYNPSKHYPIVYILFTIITMVWAIINSIYVVPFYTVYIFWVLLFGPIVVVPYILFVSLITFSFCKRFKEKGYYITLFIFHLLTVLTALICYFKVDSIFLCGCVIVLTLVLDICLFSSLKNRQIASLLFNWSFEEIYRVKTELITYFMKEIILSLVVIYYSVFSFIISGICFFFIEFMISKDYRYINLMTNAVFTFCVLMHFVGVLFEYKELLGILLFIHNDKKGETNDGKLTINHMESILKDLNDVEIRTKYNMSYMPSYRLKYGKENILDKQKKVLVLTSSWAELFENKEIPVGICASIGSFVYSMFYNTDMEEATRMCVSASYNSGYLGLIRGLKLGKFITLRSIFDSLNAGIIVVLPFFIYTVYVDSSLGFLLMIIGLFALFISLLTLTILNLGISIAEGYTKAIVYKFIEDPEGIVSRKLYGKKLTKYMKSVCEMDKIV